MNEKKKMYFYESFSEEFDSKMNMYDTNKRIHVIFNELLTEDISGKSLLDAGCGTGWFSKKGCERNAKIVSLDLGDRLLKQTAKKCNSQRVVGSILAIPFPSDTFDIVICSEVVEYVPSPYVALQEFYRVLKPGGTLILTTPNKLWYFAIWIANTFKLRPYQGLENWMGWFEMKKNLTSIGFEIDKMTGIHLFPFLSPLFYPILDFFHKLNKPFGPIMLNMAIRCKKK